MPEFTTVSVQEAQLRTIPGRQRTFMNEYADYIQQLPQGQAGKLRIGEDEKQTTVRRRLVSAAQAVNIPLIIKRSGNNIYFWREEGGVEQPRRRRGRPSKQQEESILPETPEQYFKEEGELEQGVPKEESPETGQTSL